MKKKVGIFVVVMGLAASVYGIQELDWFQGPSSVEVYHAPKLVSRRSGDFTANIVGALGGGGKELKYRLNDGPWSDVGRGGNRMPFPLFNVELFGDELRPGLNTLVLKTIPSESEQENVTLDFEYDPKPIRLPIRVDWATTELDVQDGIWETFSVDGEWRVRPKPGAENYDRLLAVTGAFPEGRRVETDIIFRNYSDGSRPYGFGILPLWGGHPDNENVRPRRGWNFSLAWYYSHYEGVGMEFSYKNGKEEPEWISTYRPFKPKPGVRYHLIVDVWPEFDEKGRHSRYKQRMKWYAEGETIPYDWMEITDVEGSPIPEGEYGVALVAHRSQVEFGPIVVTPLEGQTVNKRI